jgi:ABC-type dipeptide/oligopeptide/nickel transport system permease component
MFIVFSIKENILQLLTLEEDPEGDYVYIAFKLLLIGYSVPTETLASITTVGKLSIHSVASSKVSSPQSAIWCFLFQFLVSSIFLKVIQ